METLVIIGSLDAGDTPADRIRRYKAVWHIVLHYRLADPKVGGKCPECGAVFLSA